MSRFEDIWERNREYRKFNSSLFTFVHLLLKKYTYTWWRWRSNESSRSRIGKFCHVVGYRRPPAWCTDPIGWLSACNIAGRTWNIWRGLAWPGPISSLYKKGKNRRRTILKRFLPFLSLFLCFLCSNSSRVRYNLLEKMR